MKIKTKLMLAAVIAAAVCGLFALSASAYTFKDVSMYKDAIEVLSGVDVIKGYDSETFGPDYNVTRWQMALLLTKLVTGDCDSATWYAASDSIRFEDVQSHHYMGSIAYAHRNGIIIGRDNVTFDPESNITLQEGITMVVRALGYPRAEYDADWPSKYLSLAASLGLTDGLEALKPTDTLTRGHAAQLLYNTMYTKRYSNELPFAQTSFMLAETYVLTATQTLRITSNVSYPSAGEGVLSLLNSDGRFGASEKVSLNDLGLNQSTADAAIGSSYTILKKYGLGSVIYRTKNPSQKFTSGLGIDVRLGTITVGGASYEVVNGSYTYDLEHKSVPANKEIIVFGVNSLFSDNKSDHYSRTGILTVDNMYETNGVYEITIFDDNEDGYADRAIYTPYAFAKFEIAEDGTAAVAGGSKLTQITLTGKTPANGEYIIYSYNAQNRTLNVAESFKGFAQGTLTAMSVADGTMSIDTASFSVGYPNLPGASATAALSKINASNYVNTRVNFIVYGGRVLYIEQDGTSISAVSDIYEADLAVVLEVNTDNILYNECLALKVMTTTAEEKEILAAYIDKKAARLNMNQLKPGDIISYEVNEIPYLSYETYIVTEVTAQPTVKKLGAPYKMSFSSTDYTLSLRPVSGTGSTMTLKASPFAKYIIYDPTSAQLVQSGLLTSLANTVSSGTVTIPSGYTIHMSYGLANTVLGTNYIELVILRPDIADEANYVYKYSGIVYLDPNDVADSGWSANSNSDGKYNITFREAFDIINNKTVEAYTTVDTIVNLSGGLLTPGYYRVDDKYNIVTNAPLTADNVGTTVTLYKGATVKTVVKTADNTYIVTLANGTEFMSATAEFYYTLNGLIIDDTVSNTAGLSTFINDANAGVKTVVADLILKYESASSASAKKLVIVRTLTP